MHKFIVAVLVAWSFGSALAADALTPTEMRWLRGAWPVLLYARDSGLAVDIVVQPQPTPDAPPMALAFIDGRCKLVFSMRDNPDVATTAERIAPELFDAALELMAAHELGHCRRYLDGAWHGLPAGFVASVPEALAPALRATFEQVEAARREEGYADLVGLAWTRQHHPDLYPRLHAWLLAERSNARVAGRHHDTLAWARLAGPGDTLARGSIFEAAAALWAEGLAADH